MAETMQQFEGGATRNANGDKFDYEAFINPEVLHAYGEFMHGHRKQRDGSLRDGDNWQKGIPKEQLMKSMFRHFVDVWMGHREGIGVDEEALCAVLFNTMAYLHAVLLDNADVT